MTSSVQARVEMACREVEKNDATLLKGISEWSVAHRLAHYLEKYFPDYHVDCEYNRMPGEASATYSQAGHVPKRLHGEKQARPDIIIHRREINTDNLLVLELKRKGQQGIAADTTKLEAFKTDPSLHYKHACQIIVYPDHLQANFIQ